MLPKDEAQSHKDEIHGDKSHRCVICNIGYSTEQHLRQHMTMKNHGIDQPGLGIAGPSTSTVESTNSGSVANNSLAHVKRPAIERTNLGQNVSNVSNSEAGKKRKKVKTRDSNSATKIAVKVGICDYCTTVITKEEAMKIHVAAHIAKGDQKVRNIDSQHLKQGLCCKVF